MRIRSPVRSSQARGGGGGCSPADQGGVPARPAPAQPESAGQNSWRSVCYFISLSSVGGLQAPSAVLPLQFSTAASALITAPARDGPSSLPPGRKYVHSHEPPPSRLHYLQISFQPPSPAPLFLIICILRDFLQSPLTLHLILNCSAACRTSCHSCLQWPSLQQSTS